MRNKTHRFKRHYNVDRAFGGAVAEFGGSGAIFVCKRSGGNACHTEESGYVNELHGDDAAVLFEFK